MDNLWDFNRIHSWEFNVGSFGTKCDKFSCGLLQFFIPATCWTCWGWQWTNITAIPIGSHQIFLLLLVSWAWWCQRAPTSFFGQRNYGRAQLHTIAQEPYVCRKLTFFRVPLCMKLEEIMVGHKHIKIPSKFGSRIWRKWGDNNWHWGISHVHGEVNFHFGGTGIWGSNGWSLKSWWCRSFGAMFWV